MTNTSVIIATVKDNRTYNSFAKVFLLFLYLVVAFLVLIAIKMLRYAVVITVVGMKKQTIARKTVYVLCH